jgi:hypothetical protein
MVEGQGLRMVQDELEPALVLGRKDEQWGLRQLSHFRRHRPDVAAHRESTVGQVVGERRCIPSGPACSWRKKSGQRETGGYEGLGAASACYERYRSIGVWDGKPVWTISAKMSAISAGSSKDACVLILSPSREMKFLNVDDARDERPGEDYWRMRDYYNVAAWRPGMRYGQRRGTPGVTA